MSEQQLWAAVLLQAIEDALFGASSTGSNTRAGRTRATNSARTFLTKPSRDFDMVCSFAGVDPVATHERMKKQIAAAPSVEELLSKPKPKGKKPIELTHDGETLTLHEWSERTGIKVSVLASRLKQGWTVERALTAPNGQKYQGVKLTYNGETLTLREWSERTGIAVATLRNRLNMGWSIERALTAPIQEKRR